MSLITVVRPFADGEYAFGLYLGQWDVLQELTKCGPAQLWLAFATQTYMARWPRETIRMALIGEGMDPVRAEALVRNHCDGHPFNEFLHIAFDICEAATKRPDTAKKNDFGPEVETSEEISGSSISPPIGATVQ